MSRPRDTWHYTQEQQAQLQAVRAGLLEAYRRRGLRALSRKAGLDVTVVYYTWRGNHPQPRTLARLYEALK